jgi:4-alpha-glucanotransferase
MVEADTAPPEQDLRDLAAEYGVATDYWDWQGHYVPVSARTVRGVLHGLGLHVETAEEARTALAERRLHRWRQMLPPCLVTRAGIAATVWVHVPDGARVEVWVDPEDGGRSRRLEQVDRWVPPAEVDGALVGEATFAVPTDLPLGYHAMRAVSAQRSVVAPLVVTPAWLGLPERLGGRRVWGLMTQLYALRSRRSWGIGDLGDLADLCAWAGSRLGAGFVLVNPLHAAEPVPPLTASPYLPVTRRFANPIYLRVEDVPEIADLPKDVRAELERLATSLQQRCRTADLLDRDATWTAKLRVLERVAQLPLTPTRQALYDAYRAQEGVGLEDFATWCALAETYGVGAIPETLADPHSEAVASERKRLVDRVELWTRLQWWLDEQLARTQDMARAAGMPLGIIHDLAVGVHPDGADAWALADVLADRCTVGAPPDAFNQVGQDWSQPPWRPDALAELGYAPFREMIRTVLRHAGGLRVDHVPGLFRLWWVPAGLPASEGAYVRYDHEALVGILALEAHRAGAVVIGEDLGTVEPWMRDHLRERGILGTSILWFERDGVEPRRPERWREYCLASVTTHDLPPTAGYLAGEHLAIRERLGLLTRSPEEERAAYVQEQSAFRHELRREGLLPPDDVEHDEPERDVLVTALHRFLARTPALLLGVSLADIVGDRRAVNQPGTDREYPNWRVPLTDGLGRPVLLEDVAQAPLLDALTRAVRDE